MTSPPSDLTPSDPGERPSARQALWNLVQSIPTGHCASYGALGRALPQTVSGLIVGKWMATCPHPLPWWRVVAADGSLPLAKKDPVGAMKQRAYLESEDVKFIEERVDMDKHRWTPE